MLDEQTLNTIHATAPVLAEHGLRIVQRMYTRMFAANPEIEALFNPANQRPSRQHGALAHAVWAYATHIHDPSVLGPTLQTIVNKHVAHGIEAAHYPIVGGHLLDAIGEVLGEAATPEILEAWGRAYFYLADILIAQEAALRAEQAGQPHGWRGLRDFAVVGKVVESDEITSFYLQSSDGNQLPAFTPGQYVPVLVKTPLHPQGTMRCYSLSCRPGLGHLRITVKREPEGQASATLHDQTELGHTLRLGMPCGDFVLRPTSNPLLLLSGGVGLTPMVSMLEHVLHTQQGRPVVFVHAARHGRVHALKHAVATLAATHPQLRQITAYSAPTPEDRPGQDFEIRGFVGPELLAEIYGQHPQLEAYVCGPRGFMAASLNNLRRIGVPDARVYYEFFGPASAL